MSLQRIVIDTGSATANDFKSKCDLAPGQLVSLANLEAFIGSIPNQNSALLSIKVGAVQAVGLITSTGIAVNNETMLVCNVTLTAKTSGAVAASGEFNISAVVATQASSIAAAINAVSTLTGKVSATSALGVVTVTASIPGLIGNGLQLSESLTNVAITAFASGTDGTAYSIDLR